MGQRKKCNFAESCDVCCSEGLNYLHAITEIKIGCQPVISGYIYTSEIYQSRHKGVSFYIQVTALQQQLLVGRV